MKKLLIVLFVFLLSFGCLFACDFSSMGGNEDTCTHGGGWADCSKKAVCNLCGEEYGELNPDNHTPNDVWTVDGDKHYLACANGCGAKLNEGEHTGGTATCQNYAECAMCGVEYGTYNMNNHKAATEWS